MSDRPDILFVVSDQERQRDWLPKDVRLPNRERLIESGLEMTRFYAHASPCTPSRASLFTGRYLAEHGLSENIWSDTHPELQPTVATLGSVLRARGYHCAYLGKWHLSRSATPDLEQFGYSDWSGNDRAFLGLAGSGYEFDPTIAGQAARWLREHARDRRPWFLTVALVNPHDVMWYPVDQPDWQARNPDHTALVRRFLAPAAFKDDPLPPFPLDYQDRCDRLPASFHDDLSTKPEVQRRWIEAHERFLFAEMDRTDERLWRRHLDYYVKLHELADESLGTVLGALDDAGRWDDTVVLFTSDHGDLCGAHGLRSKGPCAYEEVYRVPLYARVPGRTRPGSKSAALATHVDLAETIARLGGATLQRDGVDLLPLFEEPSRAARESVLLATDHAWFESCIETRYAVRAIFDGRFKYARYYGCGGGFTEWGIPSPEPKRVGVDAPFEEQEHELYDLAEDPHEMVNLARDRGRGREVRAWFGRLRAEERRAFGDR